LLVNGANRWDRSSSVHGQCRLTELEVVLVLRARVLLSIVCVVRVPPILRRFPNGSGVILSINCQCRKSVRPLVRLSIGLKTRKLQCPFRYMNTS
jgi:hypothetical protein